MIITDLDQVMCENRNTELLMQEIYRIKPNTKFTILGELITEKEALMLYKTIRQCSGQSDDQKEMIYIPIFEFK